MGMGWIRFLKRRVWGHPLVLFVASLLSMMLFAACDPQSIAPTGQDGTQGAAGKTNIAAAEVKTIAQ